MRQRVALLVLLALGAGARAGDRPAPETLTLANGLRVVLEPVDDAMDACLFVLFDVGGDHDPEGRSGLTRLVERVYTTAAAGTTPSRTAQDIAGRYPFGWTARTGDLYTAIGAVFEPEDLEAEVADAAARMRDLRITVAAFERERARLLAEVRDPTVGDPLVVAMRLARERVRPAPRGGRAGGTAPGVQAITRDQVEEWWRRYYKPRNSVIVLRGQFELAHGRDLARKAFEGIPAGEPPPEPGVPGALVAGHAELVRMDANSGLGWIVRAVAAPPPTHPDFVSFLVGLRRIPAPQGVDPKWPTGRVAYSPFEDPSMLAIVAPLRGDWDLAGLVQAEDNALDWTDATDSQAGRARDRDLSANVSLDVVLAGGTWKEPLVPTFLLGRMVQTGFDRKAFAARLDAAGRPAPPLAVDYFRRAHRTSVFVRVPSTGYSGKDDLTLPSPEATGPSDRPRPSPVRERPYAKESIPKLIELLSSAAARWDAERELMDRGPEVADAVVAALADPKTRKSAASVLQTMGPFAKGSRDAVAKYLLRSTDPDDRRAATYVMQVPDFDALSDVLRGMLADPDPSVRARIASKWVESGAADAGAAKQVLLEAWQSSDERTRTEAIRGIGSLAQTDVSLVPVLGEALPVKQYAHACDAASALAALGPRAKTILPALESVLAEGDATEGLPCAVVAHARVSGSPTRGLPVLRALLASNTPTGLRLALEAISFLGPAAAPLLPDLSRRAQGERGGMVGRAFMDIGSLPSGTEADLLRQVGDLDGGPDAIRALALFAKSTPEMRSRVGAVLNMTRTLAHRATAALALMRWGDTTDGPASVVQDALENDGAVEEILADLATLGHDLAGTPKSLASKLRHPRFVVRASAALALAKLGSPAKAAEASLVEGLGDRYLQVRIACAYAIAKVFPDGSYSGGTGVALRKVVAQPVWEAAAWAAVALSKKGPLDPAGAALLARAKRIRVVPSLKRVLPLQLDSVTEELPTTATAALGR